MHLKEGILLKRKRKMQALSYDECQWIQDLLKEGVPLSKALPLLSNRLNQSLINEILEALDNGNSISKFFFKKKEEQLMFDFFQSLYCLPEALEHCLIIIKTKNRILKNLLTKSLYPSCILLISCICLLFVCFIVMPNITNLIEGMGLEYGRGLYRLCTCFCLLLCILLIVLSGLTFILVWASINHKLIDLHDRVRFQYFKNFFKFIFTYLFCSYLNVLLQRSISTKEALNLLSGIEDGITNVLAVFCQKELEKGKEFSITLWESGLISEGYYQILSLGNVSNQVLKYSENYERLSLLRLEKGVKTFIYVAQILSYGCVAMCAIVIMQLLMSPLQLFELL